MARKATTLTNPSSSSSSMAPPVPPKKSNTSSLVHCYLIAYNILSALGWSYIFFTLLVHLSGLSNSNTSSAFGTTSSSKIGSFFSYLSTPFQSAHASLSAYASARYYKHLNAVAISSYFPKFFHPLIFRASSAYEAVGTQTTIVQSFALLEVIHAALGWVRSPVATTAAQVSSRLFLVWGVVEQFEVAQKTPLYATMVLAWSITEVLRYTFYFLTLLPSSLTVSIPFTSLKFTINIQVPRILLYLRYTTFYILYPIGASSEAFVNLCTLPRSSPIPSVGSWARGAVWGPMDLGRAVLFIVWWPGLYVMYTYMISQRRKVLGTGRTLGSKPKSL
ncbi:tyrosine phosphatase [Pyrrhoderma noxium]|uniref:Very-long-chain (3R)-3-hydroxyacyl-CoA dehydratase n=1 Tax=Pyrrhoderma noxium TaxID=2282107 RepID=A0A286UFZ7_9AGAM|nr:tyrosine phosphatase [Pyrrhoderma noxium]